MNDLRTAQMQLLDRLHHRATQSPQAIAYVDAGTTEKLTWAQLFHRTAGFAIVLRSKLSAGAVVLIRLPNCCDFPVAFLGTLAAGCTAFPISIEAPDAEVHELGTQVHPAGIISFRAESFDGCIIPQDALRSEAMDFPDPQIAPDGIGLMLLSSGSTGKPKIVCRSFASLDAACDQMCRSIGIGPEDRVLATVPLCHSYGIEHGLLAPVWAGAAVHLGRGMDLQLIQRELLQSRITLLPAVPSVYEMLANLLTHGEHFPSLRAAYSAGAPLPTSVADRFFDRCGIKIGQLFGATEIGSVTYSDPTHSHFNLASVGQPMPGVEIKIVDEHLWISASSMFSGYLHEDIPQTVDGFYPTGDLARLDDHGNLIITGRAKLLIDVGGLKVNPLEVEQVLMQHPAVGDCIVIPVRQSETVVRLKAIVTQRSADQPISIELLRQFARDRLASYKVPRSFEVRANLPRTQTGKILRQQVQA